MKTTKTNLIRRMARYATHHQEENVVITHLAYMLWQLMDENLEEVEETLNLKGE